MAADKIIHSIGALATASGDTARAGAGQGDITILNNAYVAIKGETILAVGEGAPPAEYQDAKTELIDACGRLVTPGLVDAHTHLVFGGWREHEFALKLKGVPYLDILKDGGGILSTVKSTRESTEEELFEKGRAALEGMLLQGVTACEAKSGYGLTVEDELKQLRVAAKLNQTEDVEVVSTFMGAHAMPEEYKNDRESYIRLVIDKMLPAVHDAELAEFCDVFCETAAFTAEESERILQAAKALGMGAKIHADEINAIGGAEVAGRLSAVSAEHLIAVEDAGVAALSAGGVIAALLPSTSFYLDKPYAPARRLIEAGVPVAIASDFNPGSTPSMSLQFAMCLACIRCSMTPEEALTAVTLNAAAAVGRADKLGTIEPGKQADIVIWDAPNLERIFYRYGTNQALTVFKRGRAAVENGVRIKEAPLSGMIITQFLDLLAGSAPAPGGGSASALCGAIGTGLGTMAASLTAGRPKFAAYEELMQGVIERGGVIRSQMVQSIDEDTEAFNKVMGALKLPKSTDEEKKARKAALQAATKEATLVPFSLMERCLAAVELLHPCIGSVNPNCASDLGVGALNIKSAAMGAWLNVLINLGGISDKAFAEDLRARGAQMLQRITGLADEIYEAVLGDLT